MADYKNIYLIGIGGIGMSAIARYYKQLGKSVSGYDKTPSELTDHLQEEGIEVHFEDNIDYIPKDKENTLVVWTPAIPDSLGEIRFVREHEYKLVKRSMILGEITLGKDCLAIAGTHGKTSTSTLTAHILTESGKGCSAFLGGISKNYNTNLLVSDSPAVVAEADEFDRSFLQLHPEIALITAMDADHLDIYGNLDNVKSAFREFASQVRGTTIIKHGLEISQEDTKSRILSYSLTDKDADYHTEGAHPDDCGHFVFDLVTPRGVIRDIRCGAPGRLNAENSVGAAAVCLEYGTEPEAVRSAIGSFCGVKRRLDLHVNTPKVSYIDDYAHHPEELSAAIKSIRDIFPKRNITAIFQPHLYTRTRDFAEDFARALSAVDRLILLDIYPAREEPIEGVTSEIIFRDVTAPQKMMATSDQLMALLENMEIDVLVTFGAGNIDRFVGPITEMLKR